MAAILKLIMKSFQIYHFATENTFIGFLNIGLLPDFVYKLTANRDLSKTKQVHPGTYFFVFKMFATCMIMYIIKIWFLRWAQAELWGNKCSMNLEQPHWNVFKWRIHGRIFSVNNLIIHQTSSLNVERAVNMVNNMTPLTEIPWVCVCVCVGGGGSLLPIRICV